MSSPERAAGPMEPPELADFLNLLLEAERAGAAVLAVFMREIDLGDWAREEMRRMQRDEAHNCAVLISLLAHVGQPPSRATGEFLGKALAVDGDLARLAFLNRGQAWVERRITEALPRIADAHVHRALDAMRISHAANIAACDAVIAAAPAERPINMALVIGGPAIAAVVIAAALAGGTLATATAARDEPPPEQMEAQPQTPLKSSRWIPTT